MNWSRVHHLDQQYFALQFPELFRDELGTLRGVEAKLHVTKHATVRCFKARPVPVLQPPRIYQGPHLNAEGIHSTNEKVGVIADAPVPRDRSELKSCLGMVRYYYKFRHNISASWPLYIISYRTTSPGPGAQLSKPRLKSQRRCFSQQKYWFTITCRCLTYSRATRPPTE